jgi:CheY-like chemotaxis protein
VVQGVKPLHVLVVDDEQIIADSLAEILRTRGFEAKAAYSGEQALESASVREPNVLISDVMMPGINGIELAVRISNQFPACRVVLFSGQAATSDLFQSFGASSYQFKILTKPVHPRDILECLAS